jgi:hypothetical protein
MAHIASHPGMTLGSVVAFDGEYGVVWYVARHILKVLPLKRGPTSLRLSLEYEVALHLPTSLAGWGIVPNEMVTWPRPLCSAVGEVDERCLLKILVARARPAQPDHFVMASAISITGSRPAA